MIPESRLESTEHGLAPKGDGWFVLNARGARWLHAPGRSAICEFEGFRDDEQDFLQFGINLNVLDPGTSMGMYHWEADQEDFFVLAAEAVLIVEGEERPLRRWDFFHCRPERGTSSSEPETLLASCWQPARASTRGSLAGLATRSTRRRCGTA